MVRKLFVGPLLPVNSDKPKHSIAAVLPDYEQVKESTLIANNLKEQRAAIAKHGDAADIQFETITSNKVYRRRRDPDRLEYHHADKFIARHSYWTIEKRSLTKYASNSLMVEFRDCW